MTSHVIKNDSQKFQPWGGEGLDQETSEHILKKTLRSQFQSAVTSNKELEDAVQTALEDVYQEAQHRGYQAGFSQGLHASTETNHQLAKLFAGMVKPSEQYLREVEHALVSLAVMVAKQLVRREIKHNPEQIVGIFREALQTIPFIPERVDVYLHPDDLVIIEKIVLNQSHQSENIVLQADPNISQGGCKVVANHCHVDATLESRIAQLVANIIGGERTDDG